MRACSLMSTAIPGRWPTIPALPSTMMAISSFLPDRSLDQHQAARCSREGTAPDPGGGRVGGHVEMEQTAAAVADQEEDVEGLESQGLDHEQVSGPDGLSVVGEEGAPALAGRAGPRRR